MAGNGNGASGQESGRDQPATATDARLLPPQFAAEPVQITSSVELRVLADTLSRVKRIAVDLESDSLYHYFDKVCLLQLTAEGVDYIIDPLAGCDLSPLAWVFADPAIEKVFHAADNDLAMLHRAFSFEVLGVFDTMVAAQVVGHRQLGLNNLLGHYFGIKLDKRYQRHDWSSRPLEHAHIQYARSDTHFLEDLRELLLSRVAELGREPQLKEELSLVERKRAVPRQFSPEDCLRISGTNKLDARGLKVLRSLFMVRDQIARQEDLPTFRVLPNDTLIQMARDLPSSRSALFTMRGMNPRTARTYHERLLDAIQRGLSPKATLPRVPRKEPRPAPSPESEARLAAFKVWRTAKARELDLDVAVVASNSVMGAVVERMPADLEALRAVPEVRNWQVEAFGQEWLELLRSTPPGGLGA